MEKATFGAGCFWHVEEEFRRVKGVLSTQVGFMGGILANPSYGDVCTGDTEHAEVVEVSYDPTRLGSRVTQPWFSTLVPNSIATFRGDTHRLPRPPNLASRSAPTTTR